MSRIKRTVRTWGRVVEIFSTIRNPMMSYKITGDDIKYIWVFFGAKDGIVDYEFNTSDILSDVATIEEEARKLIESIDSDKSSDAKLSNIAIWRCKDCEFYEDQNTTKWCDKLYRVIRDDWFCADFSPKE